MQCLFSVSCIDYAGLFVVAREREVLTCVNIQSNELLPTKKWMQLYAEHNRLLNTSWLQIRNNYLCIVSIYMQWAMQRVQ